jgi:carboxymethylenebutenolidase
MNGTRIGMPTSLGTIEAYISHPVGPGPWPAVLFFMDGLGWRPALFAMADRLASYGHYVLLPNMFWRAGPMAPFDPTTVFAGGPERERLMAVINALPDRIAMSDTVSFLSFLEEQPAVREARRIACVGYCMGGGFALNAACLFPDSIIAAASFHGGRFLTAPEAPEAIAKLLRARVYIGVADGDRHHTPDITRRLAAALEKAKVRYAIEDYAGAAHGFAVPDTPAYNAFADAQHWDRLLALLRDSFA